MGGEDNPGIQVTNTRHVYGETLCPCGHVTRTMPHCCEKESVWDVDDFRKCCREYKDSSHEKILYLIEKIYRGEPQPVVTHEFCNGALDAPCRATGLSTIFALELESPANHQPR